MEEKKMSKIEELSHRIEQLESENRIHIGYFKILFNRIDNKPAKNVGFESLWIVMLTFIIATLLVILLFGVATCGGGH